MVPVSTPAPGQDAANQALNQQVVKVDLHQINITWR